MSKKWLSFFFFFYIIFGHTGVMKEWREKNRGFRLNQVNWLQERQGEWPHKGDAIWQKNDIGYQMRLFVPWIVYNFYQFFVL